MQRFKHKDTYIHMGNNGHFFLSTEKKDVEDFAYGYVNTNVMLDANYETEYEGISIMPTDDFFKYQSTQKTDKGFDVFYTVDTKNLTVQEEVEYIPSLNVIRQKTTVKNNGTDSVRLAKLCATNVLGIGLGGTPYYKKDRFNVYYCLNHMQGEGQWRKKTLKELDLYPASRHPWERCAFRLQSFASWSTNDYYPLVILEDTETNECWFFEREGADNWFIEITAFEGFGCPFINVSIGGADEILGWTYDLQAGESYTSNEAVYGVIKGGFQDAVRELIKYKRMDSRVPTKIDVAYNTFMNCHWGFETKERIIPLVDAAHEAGVELFVIDGGWVVHGSWTVRKDRFPDDEFEETIRYILSKGMKAGLWMELDFAGEYFEGDCLRYRNGKVVAHHRRKANFRNPKVIETLLGAIDYIYRLGVRYIKNDHNNDERCGSNMSGESTGEGTRRNTLAFYELIEEIHRRYPDLVIENCAAGGARCDHGTLKHFSLQSTSDQEDYKLYPSILTGCLAYMPPEKAGIWSYPYPLLHKYTTTWQIPDDVLATFADGRETVFNMVSGMCGYMYLSGNLHLMNDCNKRLVKESIAVYKTYKDSISTRLPAFLMPMKSLCDNDYYAVGLEGNEDMLLAVWGMEEKEFALDLTNYPYTQVEKIYPIAINNCAYRLEDKRLHLSFDAQYSACMFRLKK